MGVEGWGVECMVEGGRFGASLYLARKVSTHSSVYKPSLPVGGKWCGDQPSTRNPQPLSPQALNTQPSSPQPSTLKPSTRNPQALSPQHSSPQPSTLKPSALNTQPLSPQPSTPQPSTPQPSTLSPQPSPQPHAIFHHSVQIPRNR